MFPFQVYRKLVQEQLPGSVRFAGSQLGPKADPSFLNAARVLSPSVPAYEYPSFQGGLFKDSFQLCNLHKNA